MCIEGRRCMFFVFWFIPLWFNEYKWSIFVKVLNFCKMLRWTAPYSAGWHIEVLCLVTAVHHLYSIQGVRWCPTLNHVILIVKLNKLMYGKHWLVVWRYVTQTYDGGSRLVQGEAILVVFRKYAFGVCSDRRWVSCRISSRWIPQRKPAAEYIPTNPFPVLSFPSTLSFLYLLFNSLTAAVPLFQPTDIPTWWP
jgi:hypothetical protein